MCIYVYIPLQRECETAGSTPRTRALHLELPTGVPNPIAAFQDEYGPKI